MNDLKTVLVAGFLILEALTAANGRLSGVTYFDYAFANGSNHGFDIHRTYFTFEEDLAADLRFKFQLDAGRLKKNEANQSLYVYIKNAKVDWDLPFGRFTLGLQGLNVFNLQEKNWAYRFIEKSPMDLNKWTSSADLGIGYSRAFPTALFSVLLTNGGGYKQAETDPYKKLSVQAVLGEKSLDKKEGFNIGGVWVYEPTPRTPNVLLGAFGGYAAGRLRMGAEWERLTNHQGTEQIMAAYGNFRVKKRIALFTRIDRVNKGYYFISGINLRPENGLLIAPNVRVSQVEHYEARVEYRVNFQFKF